MATSTARAWQASQDRMHPNQPHAQRKLSPRQIDEVRARRAGGETVKALAAEYGVTASIIRRYS